MKNVVIVERIKTIREGIKILINRFSDLDCLHSFESFDVFIKNIHKTNPTILLIDLENNKLSMISKIRNLKKDFPELIVLVLVMNEESEIIFDALLNGASAYVHKNSPSQKLVKVLEDAASGKMVVNSLIARRTIKYINDNMLREKYLETELRLLERVIEGNNLFAISKSMNMNISEIKTGFRRIYTKLFLSNINSPTHVEF